MIIASTKEDFEYHWGFLDYTNKTILDIGADFGSTAHCFLHYNAKKVYAIEGNSVLYSELTLKIIKKDLPSNVIPIKKMIKSEYDFMNLFIQINADIVKIDIEGDEIHLIKTKDGLLKKYKEYIIESHHTEIKNRLIDRFTKLNYELKLERPLSVNGFDVLYFKRKD